MDPFARHQVVKRSLGVFQAAILSLKPTTIQSRPNNIKLLREDPVSRGSMEESPAIDNGGFVTIITIAGELLLEVDMQDAW